MSPLFASLYDPEENPYPATTQLLLSRGADPNLLVETPNRDGTPQQSVLDLAIIMDRRAALSRARSRTPASALSKSLEGA